MPLIKADPRTRIITVMLISSTAVMIKGLIPLVLLLLLTLLICGFLSVPLLDSIKKLKRIWYFFIVLALVQSIFTSEGEVLIGIGNIRVLTTAGIETGISIVLRMSAIIFSALIIASAPALDIVYGFIAMKLPYEIAFMVLLSMKFLPIFKEEFLDSIIAVQLAGADLKRIPLKEKLSLYSYILMPSVTKALSRARYISLSMECRCFRAYPTRTSYIKLQMRQQDYFIIMTVFAACLGIITLNFNHIG